MLVGAETYLEYSQPGVQPAQLKRLKQGAITVRARLDLHGLTTDKAYRRLFDFLEAAFKQQKRHLLIIHGKGVGSEADYPILKNEVNDWLRQAEQVMAFCSARPEDGGRGAVYVLLQANKR